MHRLRNLCLFTVASVGCSVKESNTTAVTTGNTNGNTTVASTPPTEGGGVKETGTPVEATSSGGNGEAASSSGEGSMTPAESSGGDVDGESNGTGEPVSTDSTTEAGSSESSGSTGSSGEIETNGDELCDSSLLLAMTPECLPGFAIASAAWADAFCAQTFGDGWIWLEHHQQGGWYVEGTWIDDHGIGERGWVYVNDQTSACYETNYGVTWVRAAFLDWQCRADCWSTIGLEGPEYNPQDGEKCNSYEGDTPCDHCRPLICARP